jgi:hypothetical protein
MPNAQTEEVPFLGAMERDPEVETTKFKFWLDARFAALRGVLEGLKQQERGPKDYPENDLERGIRIGRSMAPRFSNGDSDGDKGDSIKRWHLVLAVVAVVVGVAGPVIGAAWSLSMQISSQSAMISNIRDHQREQDERATRVEQQLQQLSRDRR